MLEAVGHTKTGSGACEVSEVWEVVAMQRGNQPLALADRREGRGNTEDAPGHRKRRQAAA